jgi:SAM-dependent methyltransferase
MFPLSFPATALRSARAGDWVLDPFCGRGTTNFAARLAGLPSVGIDVNPVAVAIAQAKLARADAGEVVARCDEVLRSPGPRHVPQGEFWALCFHPDTLRDVCRLREALLKPRDDVDLILRAILLGVLHGPLRKGPPAYVSNQMPRTFSTKPGPAVRYWRKHGLMPAYVDVREVVRRRARHVLAAVPPRVEGHVLLGDARSVDPAPGGPRFNWVVTSPPYVGMRTYRPDQWLRNWFLGGPDHVDYGQEGQLGRGGVDALAGGLGRVWANVARACRPGAKLVVRFGALPSEPIDPSEVLKASLRSSGAGWRVTTIRSAGHAAWGRRQASQFRRPAGRAQEEIDLYARLEA